MDTDRGGRELIDDELWRDCGWKVGGDKESGYEFDIYLVLVHDELCGLQFVEPLGQGCD